MSHENLKGWKELPIGAKIVEAGNSHSYNTGSWRSFRPVWDSEKCTHCLLCWVYCPDSAVNTKEGKFEDFDLLHCKGCGICARECPPKIQAIKMVDEQELATK
ncbi:MAG: 4Fe-4S binding protein [bacterium]